MQKYSVNQHLIETILAWVNSGEIAIPEIQRPFVWDSSKVRDLMDSLYQGYPIGYVIAWRNPNVKLKDGSLSEGKKVLIDGQQRVTALTAAILGQYVINKNYQRVKIKIAFNPIEERFEVQNPAILKDKVWLHDITDAFSGKISLLKLVRDYSALNPDIDEDLIENSFSRLISIVKKPIGMIELAPELDIETVTEIFIRINSKGVVLSQADFAMSKIASDTDNGGNELRKAIDYFCHLAIAPDFYKHIVDNDKDFAKTEFFQKMSWLKTENEDLYDPSYNDLIRVAFTSQFNRGRLSDLVSLLSGRNFETRSYETEIAEQSFLKLKNGNIWQMVFTDFKSGMDTVAPGLAAFKKRLVFDATTSIQTNQNETASCVLIDAKVNLGAVQINVLDINGRIVKQWDTNITSGFYQIPLNVSSFNNDIYLRNIQGKGFQKTLKMVKH